MAAVSLQVRRSGKIKRGYEDALFSMCARLVRVYACWYGYLNERNLEEMWEEIRVMGQDAVQRDKESIEDNKGIGRDIEANDAKTISRSSGLIFSFFVALSKLFLHSWF